MLTNKGTMQLPRRKGFRQGLGDSSGFGKGLYRGKKKKKKKKKKRKVGVHTLTITSLFRSIIYSVMWN